MASLWVGISVFLVFSAALIVIFAYRLARKKIQLINDRKTQNVIIFKQRLADYEKELERGDISQEQFESLKLELDKTLLSDALTETNQEVESGASSNPDRARTQFSVMASILAIGIPVISLLVYFQTGASNDVRIAQIMSTPSETRDEAVASMNELVERLEKKIQENPDDLENSFVLARSYMSLKRPQDGARVLKQISTKLPDTNPEKAYILGQYAQALYFSSSSKQSSGKMTPEIKRAINDGLQINPKEASLLGIMGVHSFDSGEYREAIRYWKDLLAALPPGKDSEAIKVGIERAKEKLVAAGETFEDESTDNSDKGVSLRVAIELSDELKSKVNGNETVFVLARIPGGPKIPLAVKRMAVSQLPAEITLSDSDAMGPMAKLSSAEQAEIVVRVSKSGDPKPQKGDFQIVSNPVDTAKHKTVITLIVDQVIGEEVNSQSVSAISTYRSNLDDESDGKELNIVVRLSDDLLGDVAGDETVFVLARAHDGPRMPLAVKRLKASQLPLEISLSDADAMAPMAKLSAFEKVDVVARISKSGDALPQSGDLEGSVDQSIRKIKGQLFLC